ASSDHPGCPALSPASPVRLPRAGRGARRASADWCPGPVPFGNRQLVGLIAGIVEHSSVPAGKLKQAAELLDHQSLLPDSLWQLCRWTASYYQHGLGDTLSSALPVLLRQGEPALARQDM